MCPLHILLFTKEKMDKNIGKQGFTIIEVVLVLAIAGLVFLMVFVAFPALQRNQRDAQRRQDFANLSSQLSQLRANGLDITKLMSARNESNPSAIPSNFKESICNADSVKNIGALNKTSSLACNIIRNYTNNTSEDTADSSEDPNNFRDPDGEPYLIYISNTIPSKRAKILDGTAKHYIMISFNTKCNSGNKGKLESVVDPNAYTIRYRMENDDIYCQDGSL